MKAEGVGRFKPYPVYKDSGVEWLGEIPEHWELKPLKYFLRAPLPAREFQSDGGCIPRGSPAIISAEKGLPD